MDKVLVARWTLPAAKDHVITDVLLGEKDFISLYPAFVAEVRHRSESLEKGTHVYYCWQNPGEVQVSVSGVIAIMN